MNHVGIDPGVTGAIALITDEEGPGPVAYVADMPTKGTIKGGTTVCPHSLAEHMREYKLRLTQMHVLIEQVSSRPGQGVASTCKTCRGAGVIEGVLASLDIPYQWVHPSRWKLALGLRGAHKDASRGKAMELYPFLSEQLTRKKDHGRAEALLIAHYARHYT